MIALILTLSLGASPPDAGAPPRDKPLAAKAKLIQMLNRDPAPTLGEVRATDADVAATLAAIAGDKAAPTKARARAIDLWAAAAPSAFDLAPVVADRSDDEAVRIAAMKASLRVRGAAAVETARRLLDDPKASVRSAAADALGRLGSSEAREALRQRLDSETDPSVRSDLERALARGTP